MDCKRFLIPLLACFIVQHHSAQSNLQDTIQKPTDLNEVVISAMHINDSLLNAPAAIGILSTKELQRNSLTDISTAINYVPGVFMQSANFTTNRISIRGIGARTPFGTNKIRAFYGSIPLTSGDSETVIDDIDIENIEQVEIIKGPLSSIYGAGLGGAIILNPQLSAKDGNLLRATTVHGSFGLLKNSFGYSHDSKSSSVNINYHNLESDGWRENSEYHREGVTLGGELFRKNKSKLTYFGNFTHLKSFLPSSINKKTFDENPKAGAPTWVASKGFKEYESVLGGLAYDFTIFKNLSNSTSVFINYKDNYEARPFDILKQYTFASGARTQFSGDFHIGKIKAKLNAGLEYFNDDYHGQTLENLYQENNGMGSVEGSLLTGTTQKRSFYNAFAQLRLQLFSKVEFQGGLNYNKTQFQLDNTYPITEISNENYSYDGIWSPQGSLLFKPTNLQTIYISVSRGFSLPSVAETLTASGTINSEIKPESGYNYEIGGKFYFLDRHLFAEFAIFRMEIQDLLVAKRVADDQYVGVNAGETLHQGIELSANYSWRISNFISINPYVAASIGEYKFTTFVDSDIDYAGNELTGVPANTVNAGITFNTLSGIFLSGNFRYVDKIPLNDSNTTYTDAYRFLDLKAGYRFEIFRNLISQITAGINNSADEKYASLIQPNAATFGGAAPRYYYPGLPVNYYGTVSISYQF